MRKWIWRIFLGSLVLLVLAALGFVIFWHWREIRFQAELEEVAERWQAVGWPLTAEELLGPAPEDKDNAAVLWSEIAALLRQWKAEARPGDPAEQNQPPWQWNLAQTIEEAPAEEKRRALWQVAQEVTPWPDIAALLAHIPSRTACYWPRTTVSLADFDMQDSAELLYLGQLLASRAVLQAWQGEWPESRQSLQDLRRLAADLQEDPFLISWLVGVAVDLLWEEAWRSLLEAPGGREHLLPQLAERDKADFQPGGEPRKKLLRALDGERIFFGQEAFRLLRENESSVTGLWQKMLGQEAGEPMPLDTDTLILGVGGWLYQWPARHYLDRDQRAYLAFQEEFRQRLEEAEMFDLLEEAAEDRMFSAIPKTAFLTRLAVPTYGGVIRRLGVVETQRQITELGQKILAHQAATGAWPEDLAEIAGSTPITDFFAGVPLVYRREGEGFVLYSRGTDRQDNGGENPREDLLWRFGGVPE